METADRHNQPVTRALVVELDERDAGVITDVLDRDGHPWSSAEDVADARRRLAEGDYSVLLVDVDLPGRSGIELAEHALAAHPETAVVIVMGSSDSAVAHRMTGSGAHGFIIKPFDALHVTVAVESALHQRQLEADNRSQRDALERVVRARTAALERSAKQLKLTREETVRRLSRAVEYRDEETGGHTERLSRYCALLASRAALDAESIRVASPMHDVGKVAVPDHILLKTGRLTPDERREMERHTIVGHEILSGSGSALLELAATIALTHHEKFDGTGYPHRVAGSTIPLEGRVTAIADVFDALTTPRPYRPTFSIDEAVEIMAAERERQFDPELLDLFLDSLDELLGIRSLYPPA
jgi:putative two-component system response regulator